jgi:hypothetical protein
MLVMQAILFQVDRMFCLVCITSSVTVLLTCCVWYGIGKGAKNLC